MRRRKCGCGRGTIAVSFGAGLLVAYVCPPGFIVAMLTIALIFLGLICCRA